MNCEESKLKIQALIDNEINEKDIDPIISHMESCYSCRNEYKTLLRLHKRFKAYAIPEPPKEWFETFPQKFFRKTGGLLGRIFFFGSYILLIAYALYSLFIDKDTGIVPKIALGGIILGFFVLLGVTIADRIVENRDDRYKEVIK